MINLSIPPITKKEFYVHYWNAVICTLGFVGYFGPHISAISIPLAIFGIWYVVAWAIAQMQFAIGSWRLMRKGNSKNWHHVFSALIVGCLYGLGKLMIDDGLVLTA